MTLARRSAVALPIAGALDVVLGSAPDPVDEVRATVRAALATYAVS